MSLAYPSGEVVETGDRIRYAGEPGQVEFVADASDPDTAWYVEQYGGGHNGRRDHRCLTRWPDDPKTR